MRSAQINVKASKYPTVIIMLLRSFLFLVRTEPFWHGPAFKFLFGKPEAGGLGGRGLQSGPRSPGEGGRMDLR